MSSVLSVLHRAGDLLLGLVGGWDSTLKLLLAMMALDYAAGIFVGCLGRSGLSQSGCVESGASFRGLLKKGLILMVLAVAAQLDVTMDGSFVRATTAWFYVVSEAISVLENAAIAGIPLPQKLLNMLDVTKTARENPYHPNGDSPGAKAP
ncbi:MAG: phage holin family protein [Firmicutes bacterium]|nr:phage holin family protein [Bacillota bacterium]